MTEDGIKSTDLYFIDSKKRIGSDVILPSKAQSAYFFFIRENVNKIKDEQNCTHADAMKKC